MKIILFIILLYVAFPVWANDMPIEVTADTALEWNRAQSTFTAKGNAVITQGDNIIRADSIVANYNENDDGITIQNVVATPNAIVTQGTDTLTAQSVTANFKDGILNDIVAKGGVVLKNDKETLYGDIANYDAIKRVIVVTGNVKIEQGQNILTGNRAEFNLNTNISTLTASPTQNNGRVSAVFYSKGSARE